MEIGVVSFFNVERGFGRIKTPDNPHGIFVHFSDVEEEARILVAHEMVRFELAETTKGPQAKRVTRITERRTGCIIQYEKGYGYIEDHISQNQYFFHFSDVLGSGFRKIERGFEVEFSAFEQEKGSQAKEVVISDTRTPLEKFAWLIRWDFHIKQLAQLAKKENWDFPSHPSRDYPILKNFLTHTFNRLQAQDKILFASGPEGEEYASFNTGLVTDKQEEIFAYFIPSKKKAQPHSYIPSPLWQLKRFGLESDRLMSFFPQRPPLATYIEHPVDMIYDPSRRLVPDYEHIIGDRMERFPKEFRTWGRAELIARLRQAVGLAERRVTRNYKSAIPQFYQGHIQLLLPLSLENPEQVDMALVVAKEHEIYRANTVISLDWAYQNARLLAPPDREWLTHHQLLRRPKASALHPRSK